MDISYPMAAASRLVLPYITKMRSLKYAKHAVFLAYNVLQLLIAFPA